MKMESQIDVPIEFDILKNLISRTGDFDAYSLNSNHVKSRENQGDLPCKRFDIRDLIWDIERPSSLEGSWEIEERIHDEFHERMNPELDDYFKQSFEVTTDMNGYRLIGLIPFNELEGEIEDLETDLDDYIKGFNTAIHSYDKEDSKERAESVIEYLDEKYREQLENSKKIKAFFEWCDYIIKDTTEWIEGFICIVNDDEKYMLIHKDEFDDFYKDEGWKKWEETK